jgi:Kdo2-lipid IVA lauroyltransferase/acyltransferase
MLIRLGVGVFWLLHFLPLSLLVPLGRGLGHLAYLVARRRRHIVLVNLRLCFPQKTEAERRKLAREHFAMLGRSLLERAILYWAPMARIRRLVRVEGEEHLRAAAGMPVILFVQHFVGMDAGWVRLSCDYTMSAIYSRQKNAYLDAVLFKGRDRFHKGVDMARQDGLRPAIRAIRQGLPFYFLPDMDFGPRDAIFVPFFGNPAATVTSLSRLARASGAKIIPCVNRMLAGGAGYVVKLYPPWDNFPGPDIETDTRRMNAFIEDRVLEMPEQYYWVHRRFKTRPEGEGELY